MAAANDHIQHGGMSSLSLRRLRAVVGPVAVWVPVLTCALPQALSAQSITQISLRHGTADSEYAGSNDNFELRIRTSSGMCARSISDLPHDERVQGELDTYTLDVSNCGITRDGITQGSISIVTLGDDAWLPSWLVVWAKSADGIIHFSINRPWPRFNWFSEDPDDWIGTSNVTKTEWSLTACDACDPCGSCELPLGVAGCFDVTGSMSVTRNQSVAMSLNNYRLPAAVLVAGGTELVLGGSVTNHRSAEVYQAQTRTFVPTGKMTKSRVAADAVGIFMTPSTAATGLAQSSDVFVIGGSGGATSAERFDYSTGKFSVETGLIAQRMFHRSVNGAYGFEVVTIGGGDMASSSAASAEYFNASSDYGQSSRAITSKMAFRRNFHQVAKLASNKWLVVGGVESVDGSPFVATGTTAEIFNGATRTFSSTGSMSSARVNGHTATPIFFGGTTKVLVVGGTSGPGSGSLAQAELYDPATGLFTPVGNMSVPRSQHTATSLGDGRVLITGGHNGATTVATAEIYDVATGTFTMTGAMKTSRSRHNAVLIGKHVLIIGGTTTTHGSLATAELYTIPPTGSPPPSCP